MVDVVCMGELLIDFVSTQNGCSLIQAPSFKKAPGGAPANVAVGLSMLGIASAFIGMVGADDFGRFLVNTLKAKGVNVNGLCFSEVARTALAFVSLTASGERDFMFYRHPSADMLYDANDVDVELIRRARIFHYGSISLISEPSRSATLHAIDVARTNELMLSYDPNLRLPLWQDEESARQGMLLGWGHAHVIKASEEEVLFLAGTDDLIEAARSLWHPSLRLLVATQGERGCQYFTKQADGYLPGFRVDTIDTTGAGDGFVAAMLAGILQQPNVYSDQHVLEEILLFANVVGALTTTKLGAIPALPSMQSALAFFGECESKSHLPIDQTVPQA